LLDQIESFHIRRLEAYREIEEINIQLDEQSKTEHTENLNCIDLDTNITKMQAERNKLLMQFENITIDFDHYIRDIAVKTERLHNKNRREVKLMVAKILIKRLQQMQSDRKEEALKTMKIYCVFDKVTYDRLKAFKYVAYKLGKYKKANAL
jgi:hypothetical protein